MLEKLNEIENLNTIPVLVENNYFGKEITVAGLLTGSDLVKAFSNVKDKTKFIIIPAVMLKPFTQKFLDELTVEDVEKTLGCKLIVIKDYYSVKEIIDFCIN